MDNRGAKKYLHLIIRLLCIIFVIICCADLNDSAV